MARILVVDDRPTNRELVVTLLQYQGHTVVEAADGAAALAVAQTDPPDLIISDIIMPAMDGFEFVRQLRAAPTLAGTRVIFYTASARGPEARQLAAACGVNQIIVKPAEPPEILAAVNQALNEHTAPVPVASPTGEFDREHRVLLTNRLARKVDALEAANTQLRTALTQLQAAQERLVKQERLHALGQMASGIAHDFNNALAPVLGFSELLLNHPDKLENRATLLSFLRMMNTCARDATHIVQRLREFYRHRERGEVFLPVHLNDLIDQTVALTQPRWKDQALARGLTIQIKRELTDVPAVYGNPTELREALTNLIFNAVDALPAGGTITLTTARTDGHVLLRIQDTGIGMTAEVLQRCLEPFYSTKGERGTGLGLAMVYGIIQRHEGSIDIDSQPGHGTTFAIRLPVGAEATADSPAAPPPAPAQRLRVLVVDDEPQIRTVTAEYLRGDGHAVVTASNRTEALEHVRLAPFDLAVIDRAMPGGSGDELAREIQAVAPSTRVLMLTGFGTIMNVTEEIPAGVDLVLSKPVTVDQLRRAVAELTKELAP